MKTVDMSYYPISLKEIREKVARKNGRNGKKRSTNQNFLVRSKYPNVKQQINEFGEKMVRVDGDIPVDLPVENGQQFLFISYDQTTLTHGLHKYPAKFFPELPRWLIKRYSKTYDMVLDPFSGSGTTSVEALLNSRNSVGIDVDPFSRFLSKVKTTPLDAEELRWSADELLRRVVDFNPSLVSKKDIPHFPYRDNWFNWEPTVELAYMRKVIERLPVHQDVRDFYKVCFSSIIRSISNADDHCTRTVIRKKLNKKVYPSDALTRFAEAVLTNVPRMDEFSKKVPLDVHVEFPEDSDARHIGYPDDYFDLAVTSPPYANAVDYPRTHQLELYWLGLATGSLAPLKRNHVGTESVEGREYGSLHKTKIPEADEVISRVFVRDPRRAYIAYKYVEDMRKNLQEVHRTLKKGGRYVVVVGNNRIRGEVFKNWVYLMKMAKEVGFGVESYFASEIIRHFIKVPREERITTDWVVILRK